MRFYGKKIEFSDINKTDNRFCLTANIIHPKGNLSHYTDLADTTAETTRGGARNNMKTLDLDDEEFCMQYETLPTASGNSGGGGVKTSTMKKSSSSMIGDGLYANEPAPSVSQPRSISHLSFDSRMNGYGDTTHDAAPSTIVDETVTEKNVNLAKALLYRKVSNGKYVRFETVVKNKLYDSSTGKIKGNIHRKQNRFKLSYCHNPKQIRDVEFAHYYYEAKESERKNLLIASMKST